MRTSIEENNRNGHQKREEYDIKKFRVFFGVSHIRGMTSHLKLWLDDNFHLSDSKFNSVAEADNLSDAQKIILKSDLLTFQFHHQVETFSF